MGNASRVVIIKIIAVKKITERINGRGQRMGSWEHQCLRYKGRALIMFKPEELNKQKTSLSHICILSFDRDRYFRRTADRFFC